MVNTVGIRESIRSLNDLQTKFNLRQTEDEQFFTEWYADLPTLTPQEKVAVNKIRQTYIYHRSEAPLLEGTVNLLLLSPLLELAGFFSPPFRIKSPFSVEIAVEDGEEILKGLIDILVVHDRLWILVVESKRNIFPLTAALPQILAYMVANYHQDKPIFGMATNGDEFIFLKLSQQDTLRYDLSDAFLLLPHRNRFDQVLAILQKIGSL